MKSLTHRISLKTRQVPRFICGVAVTGIIGLSGCVADSGANYVEETQVVEYTQGLVTYIEEVDSSEYRIIEEVVVPNKEDSQVITIFLDGTQDTMQLSEAQRLVSGQPQEGGDTHHHHYHGSGMSSILMGGLMGYYLGKSMSTPTSPSAYKSATAYQKSRTTTTNALKTNARTTTVRKPAGGRSGFGGGSKSTRSFGG